MPPPLTPLPPLLPPLEKADEKLDQEFLPLAVPSCCPNFFASAPSQDVHDVSSYVLYPSSVPWESWTLPDPVVETTNPIDWDI